MLRVRDAEKGRKREEEQLLLKLFFIQSLLVALLKVVLVLIIIFKLDLRFYYHQKYFMISMKNTKF